MLSSNQAKAIELMAYRGFTQEEAAQEIRVHRNTITNWKKNDEFSNSLEKVTMQSLKVAAVVALRVMVGLLSSQSEDIRFKASKDILDRTGYKKDINFIVTVGKKLEDWLEDDSIE